MITRRFESKTHRILRGEKETNPNGKPKGNQRLKMSRRKWRWEEKEERRFPIQSDLFSLPAKMASLVKSIVPPLISMKNDYLHRTGSMILYHPPSPLSLFSLSLSSLTRSFSLSLSLSILFSLSHFLSFFTSSFSFFL